MSTRFRIVGIGASAGGLEAIEELFSQLVEGHGLAVLIVQHLDPKHGSMLVGLLRKKTTMPVAEARDGQAIEPERVYVIAPNTSMSVDGHRLSVRRRDDKAAPPMPINDLFESIAREVGSAGIGVLLSGSGSDGALGLRAIKVAGGLTFAQDEVSARFASMPRAAVALGAADEVMAPQAIAAALTRLGGYPVPGADERADDTDAAGDTTHDADATFSIEAGDTDDATDVNDATDTNASSGAVPTDEKSLSQIFRVLRSVSNVDFSLYKLGTIQRRLERRLMLHQFDSLAQYLPLLESDPLEARALCEDFLIHVTSFFRDPPSYEDLARIVWPALVAGRSPGKPLRIWVPGCASGEEVYSIAISLLEYVDDRTAGLPIQFFGTDASETAIIQARTGLYVDNALREFSPQRLERYFVRLNSHYQVKKSVRELCVFSRHDVTRDPPFSRVDLVSCRNLMIYLSSAAQKRLMPLLHYALNPGGFLMLGPAESIGPFSGLFRSSEESRSRLYVRQASPSRTSRDALEIAPPPRDLKPNFVEPLAATRSSEIEQLEREADRVAQARYVPPGVLCDEALNIIQFRGDTGRYLANPPGPPSTSLQRLARPELLVEVGSAIQEVQRSGRAVRRAGLKIDGAFAASGLSLEVVPVQRDANAPRWFLVFFEAGSSAAAAVTTSDAAPWDSLWTRLRNRSAKPAGDAALDDERAHLRRELAAGREYVHTIVEEHHGALEELKSAQEELLSSNEEFQSANEELETAKEELQSTNEELTTTNDELRHRNSELRDLTRELQRARDYADAIVETGREPMLILDTDLRVLRVNRSFASTFKVSRQVTVGCLIYHLGDGQWDIPRLRRFLDEGLRVKEWLEDYEITHDFPLIGRRTMSLNARSLEWSGQSAILLAVSDVTERKAVVDTMRESELHTNEFLAMLGHELRNPLAAIGNALGVCLHPGAEEGAIRRALAVIRRQLDKETRLVDDLLDLSRVTRGLVELERTRVDLGVLVTDSVEEMRPEFEASRIELTMTQPQERVEISGDTIRLGQVVGNLLRNSLKFTPAGGRICVALQLRGPQAWLSVEDNGIGIAPDVLPTIFTLFTQARSSPDRANGGLGIGLTLVRQIVEMHGGRVDGTSRGLGQGAEFLIRLPLLEVAEPVAEAQAVDGAYSAARAAAAAIPGASGMPNGTQRSAARILIVEDNEDVAGSLAMLLEMAGHQVEVTGDGPSAIEAVPNFRPDVAVLDIGLPGMDGLEIARRMRRLPASESALLIALSGYGQPEDRRRSIEAGFDHHLTKPVDSQRLHSLIATRSTN